MYAQEGQHNTNRRSELVTIYCLAITRTTTGYCAECPYHFVLTAGVEAIP